MSPLYYIEFFIISFCVKIFLIFTLFIFNYDYFIFTPEDIAHIEYDFIIVGSGTAGSLIANRLARETNFSFIVLEAGGRSHAFHDIPVFGPLLHGSVYDWQFETVPQKSACLAMENQRCKQTQGKIFGGSSKLNNMIHVRGNVSHYVDWFHGKYSQEDIDNHLNYVEDKILELNQIQYQSILSDVVIRAAKELGYNELNNNFHKGFMKARVTQKNGKRWTTSSNLNSYKHVLTNVLVEKVLIKNNICYGVQLYKNSLKLYAKKGVIISAGTFNSAKLLQLSGIGPAKLLQSLNIPLIKDLPVGENLQDHIGTGLDLVLFNKTPSVSSVDLINPMNMYHYFLNGKGPLTSPGCEAVGFLSTKNETFPNLEFMVLPVGISADRGSHLKNILGITDNIWYNYFVKLFNKYTTTIVPIILHPKSKGTVNIQSKDPNVPPLINPQYLSHSDDIKVLVEGLKLVKQFIETDAMKSIGAELNTAPFPYCDKLEFFSDDYLECYIKYLTLTSYHPVGTCSMGLPDANNTVVDTSFQLLGIDNLYVADGSVLPTLPSGNINAAIAMMANIFFEYNIKKRDINLFCDYKTIFYSNNERICLSK